MERVGICVYSNGNVAKSALLICGFKGSTRGEQNTVRCYIILICINYTTSKINEKSYNIM